MQPDVAIEAPSANEIPVPHSQSPERTAPGRFDSVVATATDDVVLLPVRFWADSRVFEIAERPDHLDKEEWFRLLCMRAGRNYQARAGGRGFFRLTRPELESLKVKNPN